MKKIIISLALILCSTNTIYAANQNLDKIENSLYGFNYTGESDTVRLQRIEKSVYGKTQNGQIQQRIAKLNKDISASEIGHEITPKEDTFMEEDDFIVHEKEPPEAVSMDYPAINELEETTFSKTFKTQPLKTRLTNLEKKVFNKTFENEDLSSRVDRLKAQVKPKSFANNGMKQQENLYYNQQPDKMAQNYHIDEYGDPFDYDEYNRNHSSDYQKIPSVFTPKRKLSLSSIEKKLYRKKFENESVSSRLDRIESSVFGTNFPEDSENERIERISSAINAQQSSSRYDNNRFSQNVATAVQIGTLILMVLACIL